MAPTELPRVADLLVRRARREGYIRPRDVSAELSRAGFPETSTEEVLALAGPALVYHKGRYYPTESAQATPQRQRAKIKRAAARLIRGYKPQPAPQERRRQDRLAFIQAVEVWTDDGRERTLLSRDLSLTGIRLISSRCLLGQKMHVLLHAGGNGQPYRFVAQVLWSCAVGEELFENGAVFLDAFPQGAGRLRVVNED
jgi:hypothetical protein